MFGKSGLLICVTLSYPADCLESGDSVSRNECPCCPRSTPHSPAPSRPLSHLPACSHDRNQSGCQVSPGFREFRVSPGVEVVVALLAGVPAAACELPRLSGVPAALEELVAARLASVGVAPSN